MKTKYMKLFEEFINEGSGQNEGLDTSFIEELNNKSIKDLKSMPKSKIIGKVMDLLKSFDAGDMMEATSDSIKRVDFSKIFKDGKPGELKFTGIDASTTDDWSALSAPLDIIIGGQKTVLSLGQLLDQLVVSKIGKDGNGQGELRALAQVAKDTNYQQFIADEWKTSYATLTGGDSKRTQNLANTLNLNVSSFAPKGKTQEKQQPN